MSATEQMMREQNRERALMLLVSREAMDEAIAGHYSRLAATAAQMRHLTHHRQMYVAYRGSDSAEMDKAIAYMREQIERDFEHTFGYAPTWRPTP